MLGSLKRAWAALIAAIDAQRQAVEEATARYRRLNGLDEDEPTGEPEATPVPLGNRKAARR